LDIYPCFHYQGMMETEKITRMLGWANFQVQHDLLPVFY
jgi:hypothetical protein